MSIEELNRVQFLFWPSYADGTEPDVVIITDHYYILFEAKYFSGFGAETPEKKGQLEREVLAGMREANTLRKKFVLVVITFDYWYEAGKFEIVHSYPIEFKWLNWQGVTKLLETVLEDPSGEDSYFASDLYELLIKKNLRAFDGYESVVKAEMRGTGGKVFFAYEDAVHRGAFVGFAAVLKDGSGIRLPATLFFLKTHFRKILTGENSDRLSVPPNVLFFGREAN